jgi:SusD family.
MKKNSFLTFICPMLLLVVGCARNLDLNPLSEGSSENWFKNENEITLALNDLYRSDLWYIESNRLFHTDRYSDDWSQREQLYEWAAGATTGMTGEVINTWQTLYKGVARANTILYSLDRAADNVSEERLNQLRGEASFFRACFYSYLIFLYGDVPFVTNYITIEQAFELGRTDKNVILKQIYDDFDVAIQYLPTSYGNDLMRVTKGAAYAFKARTAAWMLDYRTCAEAAKGCIDLDMYSLHPDYGELFLTKTHVSPELIFTLPRSQALMNDALASNSYYPRNAGGTAVAQPSWELFCAYTCTDGLPVDESPLFDPQHPFENRDPRCAATMVEFGTPHLGFIYDPGAEKVLNLTTDKMVTNKDALLNDQFAAYNGMCLKKGVDEEWTDDKKTETDIKLMRYADVLLMYAEAKMELNEIDASVLEAINRVRARAYKVSHTQINDYPAVTETDQNRLRTIIRNERRVELAWENRRWFDLLRWRLAEIALVRPVYALPVKEGLIANIASGDYFFPKGVLPEIDENGLVDLSPLFATGKIRAVVQRKFDTRQYLYPIPSKEVQINNNIKQNPGY